MRAPLVITVDGIPQTGHSKGGSLDDTDLTNRDKYDLYLNALYKYFAGQDHVKILVVGENLELADKLCRVLDILDKETKYIYILNIAA